MRGRVLICAGSDSGGGAGIQADIKAVTCLGGFAMTAITALTAQNTEGVHDVHEIHEEFIAKQMEVVLKDLGADCIKTGMLHSIPVIETVRKALEDFAPHVPLVVDPVMVAKGGHPLLESQALEAMKRKMVARATILTPNIPEAALLTASEIKSRDDMLRAGETLLRLGPKHVLMKGGHMEGDELIDILISADSEPVEFRGERIDTAHTHGTGCTTASAVAAGLAQGLGVEEAVARARDYVRKAILTAPGFGHGHGPLNHAHTLKADV
ncbi:bifunctional hydroxymethylpyrimidine kinase/phosphomethylpyrimidine kinase [Nisaea acidiphila]|uniref:hydroxymethylpyrimidine kinase n=1 Tax=Nisaea acidiphila TaxID=1862145 RepID=A0A9J7B3Q0_9PROT|nr:bifunctional hydroxymethylpyrimidine kinase/phosphomethylpyrimidine kinase [Nisaea acidiphila]UUX52253.1 bifunctional hydroxymethylpyrimidine kinase/phosphomethylpyrimidine kinase [Nisaea acidiphila]